VRRNQFHSLTSPWRITWIVRTSRPAARSSSRRAVGYSVKVRRRPAGAFSSRSSPGAIADCIVPDPDADEPTEAGLARRDDRVAAARRASTRRVREAYADADIAPADDDAQAMRWALEEVVGRRLLLPECSDRKVGTPAGATRLTERATSRRRRRRKSQFLRAVVGFNPDVAGIPLRATHPPPYQAIQKNGDGCDAADSGRARSNRRRALGGEAAAARKTALVHFWWW